MGEKSKLFWLPLKAFLSVEEPVSMENALLHSAPRGEYKHPQILLVLG